MTAQAHAAANETELDRESDTNGPLFVRQRIDTSGGESIMFNNGCERSNEPRKDSSDWHQIVAGTLGKSLV